MEKVKLSSIIRVVSNKKRAESFPGNNLEFYTNYATVVSETLKKPLFQRFLDWVLKREDIERRHVRDIQVRLLPFQKENGKFLAGRCNNKGVIRIFPKRLNFLRKRFQNHGKEKVQFYLESRAMATLIHELLHLKYAANESKVKQLTRKYFGIFFRHTNQTLSMV